MSRKPRVDRSAEEKWQIVQEGLKSGNISETCRRYEIAPNLFYRWKDEAEQGAKAALGGRSAAAAETEKDRRDVPMSEPVQKAFELHRARAKQTGPGISFSQRVNKLHSTRRICFAANCGLCVSS